MLNDEIKEKNQIKKDKKLFELTRHNLTNSQPWS